MLQGSGVVAFVGEVEPAGVPQHVGVGGEGEPGYLARPRDEPGEVARGQRPTPLGGEQVGRPRFPLALQLAELSQLVAPDGGSRGAVLDGEPERGPVSRPAPNADRPALYAARGDKRPGSWRRCGGPTGSPPGRFDQLSNFGFGQILARPQLGIRAPARGDCPILGCWGDDP